MALQADQGHLDEHHPDGQQYKQCDGCQHDKLKSSVHAALGSMSVGAARSELPPACHIMRRDW